MGRPNWPMFSGPISRLRCASLTLAAVLSLKVASAQETAPGETIAAPITVRASNSAAQTTTDKFLTSFITTAAGLEGLKFFACVATAAGLRPDLAGKIVVCALNIFRLSLHLPDGSLPFASIDGIVKAAVAAAPQSVADIVKAAIESEPYARGCIIAGAVAAAPDQEEQIHAAANETQPMSMFALAGRFNPVENLPSSNVNSPEQPPAGP